LFIVFWQKQHSVAYYAKCSTQSGLEAKRLSTLVYRYPLTQQEQHKSTLSENLLHIYVKCSS